MIQKWDINKYLLDQIENQINLVELIGFLQNKYIKSRHWQEIKETVSDNFDI